MSYTQEIESVRTLRLTIFDNTGDAAFSLSRTPRVGETLTMSKTRDDPDGNGTSITSGTTRTA